jgi:hypothetical protein
LLGRPTHQRFPGHMSRGREEEAERWCEGRQWTQGFPTTITTTTAGLAQAKETQEAKTQLGKGTDHAFQKLSSHVL